MPAHLPTSISTFPLSSAARHRHSGLAGTSALSLWLSVDPLSDKYPEVSPYVYCADNPVVIKDEDGRDYEVVVDEEKKTITIRANYIVYNEGDNVQRTQDAVNAWNSVSGQYKLNAKKNGDYTVNFDLTVTDLDDVDAFNDYKPQNIRDNKLDFVGSLPNTSDGREVYGQTTYSEESLADISHNNISIGTGRHKTIMHEIGHTLGLNEGNGVMEQGTPNISIHSGHISTILCGARIFSSSAHSNPYLANQVVLIKTKDNLIKKNGFVIQKVK